MPYFLAFLVIVAILRLLSRGFKSSSRQSRRAQARAAWRAEYQQYLQSDAWRHKRYLVLRRDNWECVECGRRATEVHHKYYLRSHREPISALQSVCRDCHRQIHGLRSPVSRTRYDTHPGPLWEAAE